MLKLFILDAMYDFSLNETSLEPECTENTNKVHSNIHRASGLPNCDSDNETNSGNIRTTVRRLQKEDHASNLTSQIHSERKQVSTSSTTSSTQASVVRSLVERGCQISNNECLVQVIHQYIDSKYNNLIMLKNLTILIGFIRLQVEHAACQTNSNFFDNENEESKLKIKENYLKTLTNYNSQNLLQPVVLSKRPQLVRSESENLEVSTNTRKYKTASLSNLLSTAAEAGQISSQQSILKLSDPLNSSDARDTVIFIKKCCLNHEKDKHQINNPIIENTVSHSASMLSVSQQKEGYKMESSLSSKEHHTSSENIHLRSELLARTEDVVSYKKRLRAKKKHRASKQQKVGLFLILKF